MIEYLTSEKVTIYCNEKKDEVRDGAGEVIIFENETSAREYLLVTLQYTEEFAASNFIFSPLNLPINLN